MRRRRRGGRPRTWAATTLAALTIATAGCASSDGGGPATASSTPATAPASGARDVPGPSAPQADPSGAQAARPQQVADPDRVRIPSIGVDAPVGPLALEPSGKLAAPTDFAATGWYEAGPEPGEPGPAVIAGHVDDHTGPAVFFRLEELRAGDEVLVDRVDGSTATFVVTRVETYPKDEFPTDEVYGKTTDPQLRLITCGGDFDRKAHSYLSNEVVYATDAGA